MIKVTLEKHFFFEDDVTDEQIGQAIREIVYQDGNFPDDCDLRFDFDTEETPD